MNGPKERKSKNTKKWQNERAEPTSTKKVTRKKKRREKLTEN